MTCVQNVPCQHLSSAEFDGHMSGKCHPICVLGWLPQISSSNSSRLLVLYSSGTATGDGQEWLNQLSGGGTIPSGLNLS